MKRNLDLLQRKLARAIALRDRVAEATARIALCRGCPFKSGVCIDCVPVPR